MLNINQFCVSTKDQVVNMSNKYEFRWDFLFILQILIKYFHVSNI